MIYGNLPKFFCFCTEIPRPRAALFVSSRGGKDPPPKKETKMLSAQRFGRGPPIFFHRQIAKYNSPLAETTYINTLLHLDFL